MGHYDNCREGYCGSCGAAPGNMVNGVCPFCDKTNKYLPGQEPKKKTIKPKGKTMSDNQSENSHDWGVKTEQNGQFTIVGVAGQTVNNPAMTPAGTPYMKYSHVEDTLEQPKTLTTWSNPDGSIGIGNVTGMRFHVSHDTGRGHIQIDIDGDQATFFFDLGKKQSAQFLHQLFKEKK